MWANTPQSSEQEVELQWGNPRSSQAVSLSAYCCDMDDVSWWPVLTISDATCSVESMHCMITFVLHDVTWCNLCKASRASLCLHLNIFGPSAQTSNLGEVQKLWSNQLRPNWGLICTPPPHTHISTRCSATSNSDVCLIDKAPEMLQTKPSKWVYVDLFELEVQIRCCAFHLSLRCCLSNSNQVPYWCICSWYVLYVKSWIAGTCLSWAMA